MCTANAQKAIDTISPARAAVRRNVGGGSTPELIDPVGTYGEGLIDEQEEQERLGAIPFNERYAFSEASAEADYQSYFSENIGDLIGQYYTGEGAAPGEFDASQYSFTELDESSTTGATRNVNIGELERGFREDFTALRNKETVKSSRERAQSSKVLSNVQRRRQARQQQTAADTGSSPSARKPFGTSQSKGATLLTGEDERRKSLLGGTL